MSINSVNNIDNEMTMSPIQDNNESPSSSPVIDDFVPQSPKDMEGSLHGGVGKHPSDGEIDEEEDQPRMRYKLLMQTLKVFDAKFSGKEGDNIDEWFHRLEFFIKPHKFSSQEKAYILVNSVKGKAFSILTEGDSSDYESLRQLLLKEYRSPGAYARAIQEFCEAKQGRKQKVSGYYHYLSKKMSRINEMAREKHGKDFVLLQQDLAIAVFLHGLANTKIKERLATRSFDLVSDTYEAASLLEDAMQDMPMKRPIEESKPFKRPFPSEKAEVTKRVRFNAPEGSGQGSSYKKEFKRTSQTQVQNGDKPTCFKCGKLGHYARDCFSKTIGAVTIKDEEVELTRTTKTSAILVKLGKSDAMITIDSGADTNCISLALLEASGITEMNRVKAPEVRFAGNSMGYPLGMATVPMKFSKDSDVVEVKFLVFETLVPECILGIDGQDQLKIRLDREQNFVWVNGVPISLDQSDMEAKVRLGSISVGDAFREKVQKFETSKIESDYMPSNNYEDDFLQDQLMSYEIPNGNTDEVEVCEDLAEEDREKLKSCLNENQDLFGYFEKESMVSSATTVVQHRLVTDGEIVSTRPYRLSPAQYDIVKEETDRMLNLGIIRPSRSQYASPVVLVPKPDKSWRFCVDYRKLNNHTKSDKYPLPNISECLTKMKGAKYFAKFDLAAGYWQIPMAEEDIEKTAFVTPLGLYEFTVMPFGL